jgi:RNA polymerase sigma-70 factor, ECF subfamily
VDADGEMVLLEDQDRSLWDRGLVGLGLAHLERSAEGPEREGRTAERGFDP